MINKFLKSLDRATDITKEDYIRANEYVHALRSMAKMAYESIYVIDYFAMNFLYVSSNPLFLCGCTPEEVMQLGYGFYVNHVPKDELEMLFKINSLCFRFFNSQPVEDREQVTISYDFHIINNGEKMLINHKLTPLAMDDNGNIWLAVCYVSISNQDKAGNIEIRKLGQPRFWRYDIDLDRWITVPQITLTKGEKEVLLLAARGLTVDEIAKRVNRSKNTIKSRKRAIFEKLDVKSITAAITFAVNYKLL